MHFSFFTFVYFFLLDPCAFYLLLLFLLLHLSPSTNLFFTFLYLPSFESPSLVSPSLSFFILNFFLILFPLNGFLPSLQPTFTLTLPLLLSLHILHLTTQFVSQISFSRQPSSFSLIHFFSASSFQFAFPLSLFNESILPPFLFLIFCFVFLSCFPRILPLPLFRFMLHSVSFLQIISAHYPPPVFLPSLSQHLSTFWRPTRHIPSISLPSSLFFSIFILSLPPFSHSLSSLLHLTFLFFPNHSTCKLPPFSPLPTFLY